MQRKTGQTIVDGRMVVNGKRWGSFPRVFISGRKQYVYWVTTTYTVDGKRVRKTFKTETAASRFMRDTLDRYAVEHQRKVIRERRIGEKARKLTTDNLLDAAAALEILHGRGDLRTAAKEYADRHPIGPAETVQEATERYLEGMRQENARETSIADKRVKLGVFCRDYGTQTTAAIDEALVAAWCVKKGFTPVTARAHLSAVKTLLNFCAGRKRKRLRQDEHLPTTWPVDRVRMLFSKTEEVAPELIPAMALLWFCGLRPAEMLRMDWGHIDLAGRAVHVAPGISKTRTSRVVDIPDNAVEWLMKYRGAGKVVSSTGAYRKQRAEIMKAAAIPAWDKDVPRHTFATVHYKTHESLERTMEQLGHFGESGTFRRHYKGQPITREQAATYWEIRPGKAQVVEVKPMEATA